MNVLVDTSVWSLALRRAKRVDTTPRELAELIREGRVVMLGPVRQELLSGIWAELLEIADYEEAAAAFNRCRERGIQGSNTDFLLCAAALRRDLSIYTTDGDFEHYARVLKLALHESRE